MTATLARGKLVADYARWHHLQVATRDIDPIYPVLRQLRDDLTLDREALAWLTVLHVTYYHLGSALAAYAACPDPAPPTGRLLNLPTGTERRAHRDPRQLDKHWHALLDTFTEHGGVAAWIDAGGTDWPQLNEHLAAVHGNGRWAAYKTAELAQKVLDVKTEVADAGHRNSTGPRHGLALLRRIPEGNSPADIHALDAITVELAGDLGETDVGQVETSLCDFHSLVKGRYYLGHDIDAMAEQLDRVPSDLTGAAFTARARSLPRRYLGEQNDWLGVDRARTRVYAQTGEIVER